MKLMLMMFSRLNRHSLKVTPDKVMEVVEQNKV